MVVDGKGGGGPVVFGRTSLRWRDGLIAHKAADDGPVLVPFGDEDLLRRFQRESVIPRDANVDQLATGFVAAVQGGYLLAQTSRDIAPLASAVDMAIGLLRLLAASIPNSRVPTPVGRIIFPFSLESIRICGVANDSELSSFDA